MPDVFYAVASPGPSILLSLARSIGEHPFSFVLILVGLAGVVLGVVGLSQTRRWPLLVPSRPRPPAAEATPTGPLRAVGVPARVPLATPRSDTQGIRIDFPAIAPRHPDVWAPGTPLDVRIEVRPDLVPRESAAGLRVILVTGAGEEEVGHFAPDADGKARSTLVAARPGEAHIVARLELDGNAAGQAARAVRFVPYRDEIVETFEDFVKWASSHFDPMDRRMTAREFVDRFADAVPPAPNPPLDRIADLYELANYSDHPVDRALYLDFVEAFLELEDAGALEGPDPEAR